MSDKEPPLWLVRHFDRYGHPTAEGQAEARRLLDVSNETALRLVEANTALSRYVESLEIAPAAKTELVALLSSAADAQAEHSEVMIEVLHRLGGKLKYAEAFSASRRGKQAAERKKEISPKAQAMAQVQEQWRKWQTGAVIYANGADFARKMGDKFPILTEGGIKNACSRWNRQKRNPTG